MKIILSRKGFDSSSGGGPSPIVDGRPLSLPIPAGEGRPGIAYDALGLTEHVHKASKGKLSGADLAHHDPLFLDDGQCLFGQCGAAQSHLENHNIGKGDLFIFFGLFREEGEKPHHRIFGWLWVNAVVRHGDEAMDALAEIDHPHALAAHSKNDAIYVGPGKTAYACQPELRLSVEDGPPSLWNIPEWIGRCGLTYHDRPERWLPGNQLQSVARGQEFIADPGEDAQAHEWAHRMLALMP